jgi:hypothetical protein
MLIQVSWCNGISSTYVGNKLDAWRLRNEQYSLDTLCLEPDSTLSGLIFPEYKTSNLYAFPLRVVGVGRVNKGGMWCPSRCLPISNAIEAFHKQAFAWFHALAVVPRLVRMVWMYISMC